MAAIPVQLGRKEWRVVTEGSGRDRVFVDGINDSSGSRRGGIKSNSSSSNGSSNNGKNINISSGHRMFHSGGGSEHSSDSDHLIVESGSANLISGVGGLASPRQNMSQPDDATIYEIKHVQQSNRQLGTDLASLSIDSEMNNSEESIQQRLHDIARQREQLQQLEIDLRAQFIARAEVVQIQSGFDEQAKQHASIVANLQEQIEARDHQIHELEQQLEERQRQLRVNQIETNEAVSQVWAKDGLLREQNNELATLRRECETAMSEQKATAAQLDTERVQHTAEIEELKERLCEKDRQIHEMEEQRRTAQEMLLYKDEQLREAQAWAARIQELDAMRLSSSHTLQVELRDRTDQFNQLWLGCQRQLADAERYYLQTIQHLQLQLAEAREQSQVCKENTAHNQIDAKEKKHSYSENKGGSQYDVNGDMASKVSKNGSSMVMNQAKAGMIPNGSVDGAVPLVLLRDMPAKAEHAAGLPVAPSPVFGMGAILPSDPMGMMHQFSMHQQGIPQNLQPSGVQVAQPAFGQFQSISAIVPPQQLMTPQQHQQPIQNNHQYLHQHQPSQTQRFPLRQQSHPNYQVNSKSQVLHTKHQDFHTHSQQNQTGGDIVDVQKEQEAQKLKEEEEGQKLSSLLQEEYNEHAPQPQEASGLQQSDQTCQQESQAMPIHLHFQPSEQSRRLDQQQLPSFSQHQTMIQQPKGQIGVQDREYESQNLTNQQNKSINTEQIGTVSHTSVSVSPSQSFGGSSHFQPCVPDCKNISETTDLQSPALQLPHKSAALDGYNKASDPALFDERSLLACFVRVIPAEASARIRISSTLPNRLGKMLAPNHWHDYKKQYGRIDEFVASHPELFVIDGDLIHLREGAHATISATTAVAKVAAAAAAAASPIGTGRLPTVAVTPVAHSQVHRLRKGILINPKDVKSTSIDASTMAQLVPTSGTQYPQLHGGTLKQCQGSVVNGSSDQNVDVAHAGIENSSSSKGDGQQADGLAINSKLDGLAINSSTGSTVNFDKAITNGYKSTGASNGRIGMSFPNRQGRFIGYVKQEFVNRPQTQESRITRIDAPTASIR